MRASFYLRAALFVAATGVLSFEGFPTYADPADAGPQQEEAAPPTDPAPEGEGDEVSAPDQYIEVAPPPPPRDPYAALLAEQSIKADAPGLIAYLRGVRPSADNQKLIASLIVQLGADDFQRRELAQRQLIALPRVPGEILREAAEGDDAELKARAQWVLAARAGGNTSSSVAVACFKTISKQKVEGLAGLLLDVLPLYSEEFVLSAGREALRATAAEADAPILRKIARRGELEARVAAVAALAGVLKDRAAADLMTLLSDEEPRVRLAAARALADHGHRASLPALVELLGCRDLKVRNSSSAALRTLTGRQTDYVAWLEPETQAAAITAWRTWIEREGRTCSLHYPLKSQEPELGRTLVCLYARNEIVEFDAGGHETFTAAEEGGCPWACQGLGNGSRLVAMYSSNTIVEYASDGKPRTRIPVPGGPMSVQRLESGSTLVACNNAQKVVEVDDQGKILWEVSLSGGPCDATRLDNGNTLVTLQNSNSIVEIDRAGKEVWKVEGLHTPRTATRLDSGNTLVCDLGTGKIMEFDATGREVWSQGGFSSPFSAQRLAAGTTLISDTVSVKEIDHTGRVISENRVQPLGRVWRY